MDMSSSDSGLSTFHPIGRLPASIRERIYLHAMPPSRNRFLEIYDFTYSHRPPKIRYIPALPALFHMSQQSRRLSVAHDGGELIHLSTDPENVTFYFNLRKDIILLSPRFSPDRTATETYKLHSLIHLLDSSSMSHVRKIAITYSGLDSYTHIGTVFRSFVRLDTLYLATLDRWSRSFVRKRLSKGYVAEGSEAKKITREVERVELKGQGSCQLEQGVGVGELHATI